MKKIHGSFKINFISGIVFLLPIALTLYVVYYVSRLIYNGLSFVISFFPDPYKDQFLYKVLIILSTVVVLVFLTVLIGMLIKTIFGKAIGKVVDLLFTFVPGIKGFYKSTKQLFDLVLKRRDNTAFKPVLIEYPHRGKWAIAFLTGPCNDTVSPTTDKEYFTVFVPTTPNPTSGFLLIAPREDIMTIDISMNDTLKMILSGGVVKEGNDFTGPTARSGAVEPKR
jgi:uncharacterized membrane protein